MAITPEQARAELARRRALKAQGTAPEGTPAAPTAAPAPTGITPEMARAELARRRAAKVAQPAAEAKPSFLSKAADTAINAVTPMALMSEERKAKYLESAPRIQDVAQSIKEGPTEFVAATAGPALAAAGGLAAGVPGVAAGFGAASALQRGAQSVDRELFKLTGGVVGNNKPTPSEVDAGLQILADQSLGLLLPLGVGKLKSMATAQRLTALQRAADAMAPKVVTPAQQAKLASIREQIGRLKVSGETAAAKLGDESVFSYNGVRFDEAAKRIKGQDWDARTFAGSLTAGKASDFGAEAKVLNPVNGKLNEANSKRLLQIVNKDNADYNKALLPDTNAFKDINQAKSTLDAALSQKQKDLRISQKIQEKAVFAPEKANTPILGSELLSVLNDPEVVAAMSSGGYEPKLAAIRAAVGKTGAMQTTELAKLMSTIQSQFVSRDDDRARAVFYESVFPKLQGLFKSAASRPTGDAAKKYSSAVLNYFENRFGLADVGGDFAKTILENKPLQAIDALSSREAFGQAQRAFEKFADKKQFGDYMRLLISSASKDAQGQPQAHLLNQVLTKINPDVPEVAEALGKDYIDNLKALQTVLNAEAIDGTKAQLTALASGRTAQKAREIADEAKSLAVNTLAYNPLGVGAAQANIGRALTGQAFQPSVESATVAQQATQRFAEQIASPARAVMGGAATQVGVPATAGYTSMEERRQAIEKKLQDLENTAKGVSPTAGGQGGPEEQAPSMGGERNIASLIGTKDDELGQLIERTTAQADMDKLVARLIDQDDLDKLIRSQMEEDTKVTKKLSTRQEEGFRTRVYKDTEGKRTVGIGFNMDAPGARKIWTDAGIKSSFDAVLNGKAAVSKEEADTLYAATKENALKGAEKLVKNFAKLGKHQQAALADMVFQLGPTGAMAFSRTRSLIEQGKFKEAAAAMLNSRNARQTPNRVKRRAYMLEHNVSLQEANDALVKSGKIAAKDSIA